MLWILQKQIHSDAFLNGQSGWSKKLGVSTSMSASVSFSQRSNISIRKASTVIFHDDIQPQLVELMFLRIDFFFFK